MREISVASLLSIGGRVREISVASLLSIGGRVREVSVASPLLSHKRGEGRVGGHSNQETPLLALRATFPIGDSKKAFPLRGEGGTAQP